MPLSLSPLLAAAAAMFIYLLSRDPVISAIAGFVSWRALNALATASSQPGADDRVRNPLRHTGAGTTVSERSTNRGNPPAGVNELLTTWMKRNRNAEQSNEATVPRTNNDGPPLLTDIFKFGRDQRPGEEHVHPRRSDDDDYDLNIRQQENEQGNQTRRAIRTASAKPGRRGEDMHTMPEYMNRLALLDKRVSLGEITDAEYDTLYDKILASAA